MSLQEEKTTNAELRVAQLEHNLEKMETKQLRRLSIFIISAQFFTGVLVAVIVALVRCALHPPSMIPYRPWRFPPSWSPRCRAYACSDLRTPLALPSTMTLLREGLSSSMIRMIPPM